MPNQRKQNKFYKMEALSNKEASISIYGEITDSGYEWDETDVSASTFKKDLDALGPVDVINLHINSPGGSVFSGISIGNMLKQNKASVHCFVDGLAASIASTIAVSADKVSMPKNSMLMLHNAATNATGNSADLRKRADDLDHINDSMKQTYLSKAGDKLDEETLIAIMNAETWLSADEAVSYGLADEVLEPNQAAACVSEKLFAKYKHVPAALAGGGDPARQSGPIPRKQDKTLTFSGNVTDSKLFEEALAQMKPSLLSQKLQILRGE